MKDRIILHIDMDAFFASVEILDDISLKGKEVIVGGTSFRSVVSTCSYEARKFGVYSGMPIFMAKELCPFGVFKEVRIQRYKEISLKIFKIFYDVTERVEPVSIDEAYLDITDLNKDPKEVAMYIKNRVINEIGLNLSVGISYNKFLAKIASDLNKPNGFKVISKDMIPEILFDLNIDKIHGLGKVSVKKLNNIGVFKVRELYKLPRNMFYDYFKKAGDEIYLRIRGIDNREVISKRERKSIGKEVTLKTDTLDIEEIKCYILNFSKIIFKSSKQKKFKFKTITVKIKLENFKLHTKSKTFKENITCEQKLYDKAMEIFLEFKLKEKIRLIGLTVSNGEEEGEAFSQISFFE